MMTRLYVDNFRCLVNFELKLDRMNLLLGRTAVGRPTVFSEQLRKLQLFIGGDSRLQTAFPAREPCRWQKSLDQRSELEMKLPEGEMRYMLALEHMDSCQKSRVKEESLSEQGKPLFLRRLEQVQLYRDDFAFRAPPILSIGRSPPWLRFQPAPGNTKLTAFRRAMSKLVIAGISPSQMEAESREEATVLLPRMENFASWYWRLSHENMGSISIFSTS